LCELFDPGLDVVVADLFVLIFKKLIVRTGAHGINSIFGKFLTIIKYISYYGNFSSNNLIEETSENIIFIIIFKLVGFTSLMVN
jgi:hypothetical protein